MQLHKHVKNRLNSAIILLILPNSGESKNIFAQCKNDDRVGARQASLGRTIHMQEAATGKTCSLITILWTCLEACTQRRTLNEKPRVLAPGSDPQKVF